MNTTCYKICTLVLLAVLLVVQNTSGSSPRSNPQVLISQGLVRGLTAQDGDYSMFLGIPYASVDLGNPFGPAEPAPNFEDDGFNAYESLIRCPQWRTAPFAPKSKNSENELETLDCLRLNIYVPQESTNLLPVLVWIYGGVFAFGYAGLYHPRELVKNGIVVVTINYRVGVYGFMCLDTPLVPGNQGLKDQYEALRWIRNNIANFGGNPHEVTISGQSAGSCSSLLHLYSSEEKLFNQVIAQSGTPLNEGMFVERDVDAAIKLAGILGFNTTDTEQALSFLSTTPPSLVIAAAGELYVVLRPCTERKFEGVNNFISTDPFSLTNELKIRNTPIMLGVTSKEHFGGLNMYGDNYWLIDPFDDKLEDNFNINEDERSELAEIIRHFYIGDEVVSRELTSVMEEFDSDYVFNSPMQRMITKLLKENANPVFEYMFSYQEDKNATGAPHSAELNYLFVMDNKTIDMTEENQLITDRITTLWSNFVKYGNPTPEPTELLPVQWPASRLETRPYLVIDTVMRLESRVYHRRMAFWDLFFEVYDKNHKLYPNPDNH